MSSPTSIAQADQQAVESTKEEYGAALKQYKQARSNYEETFKKNAKERTEGAITVRATETQNFLRKSLIAMKAYLIMQKSALENTSDYMADLKNRLIESTQSYIDQFSARLDDPIMTSATSSLEELSTKVSETNQSWASIQPQLQKNLTFISLSRLDYAYTRLLNLYESLNSNPKLQSGEIATQQVEAKIRDQLTLFAERLATIRSSLDNVELQYVSLDAAESLNLQEYQALQLQLDEISGALLVIQEYVSSFVVRQS